MKELILLFGSNIGNRKENILVARELIAREIGSEIESSGFYESEPWGYDTKNWYLNQIAIYKANLSPMDAIDNILKIEHSLGRKRDIMSSQRYCDRIIDIDVLFYGNEIINNEKLTVPHPRMQERMFVLAPLNELRPDFIHPTLNKNISALTSQCEDKGEVRHEN